MPWMLNKLLILALIFSLAFGIYQCRRSSTEIQNNQAQIEALTDKVKYYRDKEGREVAEKKLFRGSVSQLGSLEVIHTPNQRKLHTEARNTPKGSLKAAVQVSEVVEVPQLVASRVDSSTYSYSDSLVSFTATVQDSTLSLDSLRFYNDKTILLLNDKNGTRLTVKNTSPYFHSADIDGLLIPDKKHWSNSKAFKVAIFISGLITGKFIFSKL